MEYKDYNFGKYRIRVNNKKLEEIKSKLSPGKSWWALLGIVVFFFLPEFIAYIWGDKISQYFLNLQNHASDNIHTFLYGQLKSLGENSIFNIVLGVIFLVWFFIERKKDK